jgi:hypothetical protein
MAHSKSRMVSIGAAGSLALASVVISSSPAANAAPNHSSGYSGRTSTLRTSAVMAPRPALPRRGRRVFSEGHTAATDSTNWSGYAGTSAAAIQGAEGTWIVPAVAGTTGPELDSSSWVGVDGDNDSWLIQTGTEQDSTDEGTSYYPWFEIITPTDEAPEEPINAPVDPGDLMAANLQEVATGTWRIYLADSTQNWYYEDDFSYAGPGASAEWIEEAPTVNDEQSTPANWGSVHFAGSSVDDGGSWYSTGMNSSNAIDLVTGGGSLLAAPGPISAPGPNGQAFADVFGPPAPPRPPRPRITRPSPPTAVTRRAEHQAILLSWAAPKNTGGKAIAQYVIDEYRAGKLTRVLHSTRTAFKAAGLRHNWRYSFTVAASNTAYLSSPSARTAPLRPLK